MGLSTMKSCYTNSDAAAVQPNPANFEIMQVLKVVRRGHKPVFVAKIRYPNCTNFEGVKIMVMRTDPHDMKTIDPHFTPGGPIIARFEPHDGGWLAAKEFAHLLFKDID